MVGSKPPRCDDRREIAPIPGFFVVFPYFVFISYMAFERLATQPRGSWRSGPSFC